MKISFCSKEKIKSWAVWPTYIYGQEITISQAILLLLQKHSYPQEMWSNHFFISYQGWCQKRILQLLGSFFYESDHSELYQSYFQDVRILFSYHHLFHRGSVFFLEKISFPQGNTTPLKVYLKSMPSNLSQLRGWVEGRLLKHTLARTNLRPRCSRSNLDLSRFSIFTDLVDLVIEALTVCLLIYESDNFKACRLVSVDLYCFFFMHKLSLIILFQIFSLYNLNSLYSLLSIFCWQVPIGCFLWRSPIGWLLKQAAGAWGLILQGQASVACTCFPPIV